MRECQLLVDGSAHSENKGQAACVPIGGKSREHLASRKSLLDQLRSSGSLFVQAAAGSGPAMNRWPLLGAERGAQMPELRAVAQ